MSSPVQASAVSWSPCPHLPPAAEEGSYRLLRQHGQARDGAFYADALAYSQCLWQRGLPARAVLALVRGLYADLRGDEAILQDWPVPYAALAWMLSQDVGSAFLGNPRISFQHQAVRMKGPRAPLLRARAGAAWHLVRLVQPDWPGDAQEPREPPGREHVHEALRRYGLPGEASLWDSVLVSVTQSTLSRLTPPRA